MIDILYIALSVGFFALMLAYVRGCERLGRGAGHQRRTQAMTLEMLVGGVVAAVLLIYLLYTLLRPEKF